MKDIHTLLKRLRWSLTLVTFLIAACLAWYGWQSGKGLVWIIFGVIFLLFVVSVVWGGKITLWLARWLGRQILHGQNQASRQLVDAGFQQGKKLVQSGSQEIGKNFHSAKQGLGEALNSVAQDFRAKPGTVTWISAPPGSSPSSAACPACGQVLRNGAKFCSQCGKPIKPS